MACRIKHQIEHSLLQLQCSTTLDINVGYIARFLVEKFSSSQYKTALICWRWVKVLVFPLYSNSHRIIGYHREKWEPYLYNECVLPSNGGLILLLHLLYSVFQNSETGVHCKKAWIRQHPIYSTFFSNVVLQSSLMK